MGTRYSTGDVVKLAFKDGLYVVDEVQNADSDSPDYYMIPKNESDRDGSRLVGKASNMKLYGFDGAIDANKSNDVEQAQDMLKRMFRRFEEEFRPFNFNQTVVDDEGHEVSLLVDFSVEDPREGEYYVASVDAKIDEQPDGEDVQYSTAWQEAVNIVQMGATGMSNYNSRSARQKLRPDVTKEKGRDSYILTGTIAITFPDVE